MRFFFVRAFRASSKMVNFPSDTKLGLTWAEWVDIWWWRAMKCSVLANTEWKKTPRNGPSNQSIHLSLFSCSIQCNRYKFFFSYFIKKNDWTWTNTHSSRTILLLAMSSNRNHLGMETDKKLPFWWQIFHKCDWLKVLRTTSIEMREKNILINWMLL